MATKRYPKVGGRWEDTAEVVLIVVTWSSKASCSSLDWCFPSPSCPQAAFNILTLELFLSSLLNMKGR